MKRPARPTPRPSSVFLGLLAPLFAACTAPAPVQPSAVTALVTSGTALHAVVLSGSGEDVRVATTSPAVQLTDLARDPATGDLYGVTSGMLYRVDPRTGAVAAIGNRGMNALNALAFGPAGLFGADEYGFFYRIDPRTGHTTALNAEPHAEISNGDLAFAPDGTLYATVVGPTSRLVTVDPATGAMTNVGLTGFDEVYGLTFRGGDLFGVTRFGELLSIDRATGRATLLRRTALRSVFGME